MYQVNLLPWRARIFAARYRFWIRILLLQLAIFSLCLMILGSYLSLSLHQQQQYVALLKTDEEHLTSRYQQTQQAMARLKQMQLLQQQWLRRERHNQAYLQLLQQLPQQMPETLWLTSLEQRDGIMQFKGISRDYSSLAHFASSLSHIKTLQHIQLSQMNISAIGQRQFILQSHWRPDALAWGERVLNDE